MILVSVDSRRNDVFYLLSSLDRKVVHKTINCLIVLMVLVWFGTASVEKVYALAVSMCTQH